MLPHLRSHHNHRQRFQKRHAVPSTLLSSLAICSFPATNVTIGVRRKGRTEPRHYDEALTEDDVLERIREQDEKKKEKAAERAAN